MRRYRALSPESRAPARQPCREGPSSRPAGGGARGGGGGSRRFMFLARFLVKMAADNAVLNRLEQKGAEADQVIEYLKQQVALLKEKAILQASLREEKKLRVENAKLKKEIEGLKQELIAAEIRNGVKQIAVPPGTTVSTALFSEDVSQPAAVTSYPGPKDQIKGEDEEKKKKEKAEKKGEKKEKKQQPAAGSSESKPVDVSRLDLRVGCIITAEKHPDADSLYVEQVDVGEASPRTVVSGLVKHVPLDQMQNRMAILLCNLKAAKMRGVVSQAMVMCASSPDKVEILTPPPGAVPGERITFEGFPGGTGDIQIQLLQLLSSALSTKMLVCYLCQGFKLC
ncbi:aminoacyl tRNA synthase complex-interacting multifunctional protein 1 isoform X2 [Struthio camelus]|uniref:aminoacyl tRNA synthase complex-interacting multifunctional protein 1 isoform X2 n=1 Tax=Struthio camelus TaxID=8801 RepID=UPI003603F7AA